MKERGRAGGGAGGFSTVENWAGRAAPFGGDPQRLSVGMTALGRAVVPVAARGLSSIVGYCASYDSRGI